MCCSPVLIIIIARRVFEWSEHICNYGEGNGQNEVVFQFDGRNYPTFSANFPNWSFSNANIPVGMMIEDRCLAVLQGIAGDLMGAVAIAFWDTGLVVTMLTIRLKKIQIILGGCISIENAPYERSKATSNRARPSI